MKLRQKQFYKRALKNKKGQVAIFVVLIFQVLFILFAMTINISLTVYDKINMQNSLDLAAYYGAKKQAEVLNAMAHINYQMRQNWKLLAWRYRILGTLGQYEGHIQEVQTPNNGWWCPQNGSGKSNKNCKNRTEQTCRDAQQAFGDEVYGQGYCDAFYFVCISHEAWKRGISGGGQNLCTKYGVDIPKLVDLNIVAGFMPEALIAQKGIDKLQKEVGESCPAEGALNWIMTQFFLTHFRLDQKDRKVMIKEIYERTLKQGKDLDNKQILKGAQKVFCRNLTRTNCESAKNLCAYSLSKNSCDRHSSHSGLEDFNSFKGKEFDTLFGKLDVLPILQFMYSDTEVNPSDCIFKLGSSNSWHEFEYVKGILKSTKPTDDLFKHLTSEVKNMFEYNQRVAKSASDDNPMKNLSLSFFKKPEQTLYYALKLEYDYKSQYQIFSLNLSQPIKFKASAIAKPFGGNFGPQPSQNDPLIPVFDDSPAHKEANVLLYRNQTKGLATLLQPNFSRFPGDRWGLIDKRLHDNDNKPPTNFLNKHKKYEDHQRVYSILDYSHLILYQISKKDPLARNIDKSYDNTLHFTRVMELMAVYPDFYDISYYSILGNYHQTYFKKICTLLKGSPCDDPNAEDRFSSNKFAGDWKVYIRGEFGWPYTDFYIEENYKDSDVELSIAPAFLKEQMQAGRDSITYSLDTFRSDKFLPPVLFGKNPNPYDTEKLSQGNLFYPWLANPMPNRLLSSWTNTREANRYKEYGFPDKTFLECGDKALEDMPVSSACASGGRSGYSVKLISCEIAKDLEPKIDNISEYCPN